MPSNLCRTCGKMKGIGLVYCENCVFDDSLLMAKFAQTVQETEDDFIFTTIKDYCESVSEMKVSKVVLRRALYCFKTEHKEEYEYLTRREEEE